MVGTAVKRGSKPTIRALGAALTLDPILPFVPRFPHLQLGMLALALPTSQGYRDLANVMVVEEP